jgi:hypothetical protein
VGTATSVPSTASATSISACRDPLEADGFLAASADPFERDDGRDFDVRTARRAGAPAAEEPLENAAAEAEAEIGKEGVEVEAAEEVLRREPRDAGKAGRVVLGALLRVGEDRVGLGDFLEPLLRPGLLVAVGVVPQRELAERVLDRRRVGVARDVKDLVIVALCGGGDGRTP